MGRKRRNKSSRNSKERKASPEMGAANQNPMVPRRKMRPVFNNCMVEGIEIPVPTRAGDLPGIAEKIDARLSSCLSELHLLPASISSVHEAVAIFMQLVALSKYTLRKILMGMEGELAEMFNDEFIDQPWWLHYSYSSFHCYFDDSSLGSEINYCISTQQVGETIDLAAELTADLSAGLAEMEYHRHQFLDAFWYCWIMEVTRSVLFSYLSKYVHRHSHVVSRASYLIILMDRMAQRSYQWSHENVNEGRKKYFSEYTRLMSKCNHFIHGVLDDPEKPSTITVDGVGEIAVEDLRSYPRDVLSNAFSIRMHAVAFRKMQRETFVEAMVPHLQSSIANLLDTYIDAEMFDMQMLKRPSFAHLFEDMLENYPMARKVQEKRINILMKVKEICVGIMDAYDV